MTYTTRKLTRLFFDIETLANPENCALMPEPVIEAPANYKDPAKIAEYITEKTAAAKASAMEKAALDPDYGQILSIGTFSENFANGLPCVYINSAIFPDAVDFEDESGWFIPLSEAGMIQAFWDELSNHFGNCVGYNILGFDLPYLMRRSMALEVENPFIPNLVKYRTEPVTDLMQILYNWEFGKWKGLKQVAKLYRIPNECPDVDGSKVSTLTPDELRAYQVSDVKLTTALYAKMNGVYFNH